VSRPALLPLAFLVLLVAEIAAIVLVARQIGVLWTILLLLAGSAVGGWLLRREGVRAWQAFATAVGAGRPPHREALDGVLILFGGLLVLVPGFVSDVLGMLFLLPPTRAVGRRVLGRYVTRRSERVLRVRSRRGAPLDPDDVPPTGAPTPHWVIEGDTIDGGPAAADGPPDRPADPGAS
jgi:UPF0716 protein FxsA